MLEGRARETKSPVREGTGLYGLKILRFTQAVSEALRLSVNSNMGLQDGARVPDC